jgi:hypothetical protein
VELFAVREGAVEMFSCGTALDVVVLLLVPEGFAHVDGSGWRWGSLVVWLGLALGSLDLNRWIRY